MMDGSERKKLFRRLAGYKELWVFPQVVLASNEEEAACEAFACQGDGEVAHTEFEGVEQVDEISPDDLNEQEAQEVAHYLANGATEHEQLRHMTLQQVREWLRQKLLGDRQGEEQQ